MSRLVKIILNEVQNQVSPDCGKTKNSTIVVPRGRTDGIVKKRRGYEGSRKIERNPDQGIE
jgi:hypothetical protein